MTEKKVGRGRALLVFGLAIVLVPAVLFATLNVQGVSAQSPTATATAKAATPAPTAAATAKAATAVATVAGAPKSGSGGFLGQESGSNTMTIVLLVAAAASVAVAGRMVTRRR